VGSVDDVTDLRMRLIYASLEDDDLVRQLLEAGRAAARRNRGGRPSAQSDVVDVRDAPDLIDLDAPRRLGGYYLG
jgi:hypothetical protein